MRWEIVSELERRGIRCWIAPRDLRPGSSFDDQIADALDGCRSMLLIFSEHCNESEYIRREVTVAGDSQKVIIPFRIEKEAQPRRALKVRLSDLHWIDGFASRARAIDELVRKFPSSVSGIEHRAPREKSETQEGGRPEPDWHKLAPELSEEEAIELGHACAMGGGGLAQFMEIMERMRNEVPGGGTV